MKFRALAPMLAAFLALTLGAAACGSSKSSSSSTVSSSHVVSNTSAAVSKTSAAKAKVEASSSAAKAKVKAKVEASSSAAKSKAQAKANGLKTNYKPGEFCSDTNATAYKAQNLVCVNGHLKSTSTKSSTST
jgi:spermidine/putrescine-binding protein